MNRQTNIKHLPINLKKKAQRERRICNGGFGRNRLKNIKRRQKLLKRKSNFECKELEALIKSTEMKLQSILENEPLMSDIPGDVTPEELEGEIAQIEGHCTTIFVERDGLSVLKIMLPQEKPTIANLKRAIESKAQIQLKRELRENRCPSNHQMNCQRHDTITEPTTTKIINIDNKESDLKIYQNQQYQQQRQRQRLRLEQQQQQITGYAAAANVILNVSNNSNSNNNNNNNKETDTHYNTAKQSTGELVCSATYNDNHHHCHCHRNRNRNRHHRSNVSWRYLWRAYCLYNLNTKQPIKGDDGRQLLSDYNIKNGTSLKFCKREKYFGRKRQ